MVVMVILYDALSSVSKMELKLPKLKPRSVNLTERSFSSLIPKRLLGFTEKKVPIGTTNLVSLCGHHLESD